MTFDCPTYEIPEDNNPQKEKDFSQVEPHNGERLGVEPGFGCESSKKPKQ